MLAGDESTPSLTPSPSHITSPSPMPSLPVQPDHFYSPDGEVHPDHSWLSPDDDPLATKGIPVFKPTMEDFEDFEAYMTRVECWGKRSGIVKIIPPKEWSDALPPVRNQLANIRIKSPIEQHMLGRAGVFRQQNIERRKALSVREWAELCAKEDYRAPAVDEVGLKSAGEHITHVKRRHKRKVDAVVQEVVVKDDAEDDAALEDSASLHEVATPVPEAGPDSDAESGAVEDAQVGLPSPIPTSMPRKRRFPTRIEREAALAKRAELDRAFLETFDPKTDWLPRLTSASDYTPLFCSTLERRYWRNCGLGKPPWYGADSAGSLFTDMTTSWNVSSLPSALSRLLPKNAAGLPGVNTPYLYFGMWKATFAWHVEDMDLFSINYIHFGAPKFWYAVPQMRATQLENTIRSFFPRDGEKCRQFLRHKSFLASPTLLAQSSCKPNTVVQHAGEFVVTYPRGYHAGFNLGFNCAESVNFALDSWLDVGKKAQACGCVGDSVRIDVDALLRARAEEQMLEVVRPPSKSHSGKPKSDRSDSTRQKSPRKRKSGACDHSIAKKRRTDTDSAETGPGPSSSSGSQHKIMLKVPKDLGPYPCCLCVSRDSEGLLRVHEGPAAWSGCQNISPRDASGQTIWLAHEGCAMVVPETWIDEIDNSGHVEKMVFGVDVIVKDRWSLKCSLCQKSQAKVHGAPIQCTKGKCLKAFHISCAREGGQENRIQFTEVRQVEKEVVLNEMTPAERVLGFTGEEKPPDNSAIIDPSLIAGAVADSGNVNPTALCSASSDPTVVKTIRKSEYELLCTQHNPAVIAARRANKADRMRNDLLLIPPMSRVKLRVSSGVFEVSLVSVNVERSTVEVIWDQGIKREFKWSSLVWGKTDQAVGQKPSVAAPPHEQEARSKLNVRFTPGYTSSITREVMGVPATLHPAPNSLSVQPTSAPAYTNLSGQFHYGGTWSNSYYPFATVSIPGNGNSASASGSRSPYSYSSYPAAQQPFMSPLNCPVPSPSDQQPFIAPLSEAFQQVIESSVASLPPRSELSAAPMSLPLEFPTNSLGASSASAMLAGRTGSASNSDPGGNGLPPEVSRALEELQRLSTLEPERLKAELSSHPALAEAVKVILESQSVQTLAQAA